MRVLIASGCALAAGLAFAVEGVVQQGVASRGPVGEKPWTMMRRVAGNKKWWAGGCAALCSFGFQALAMAFGPLALASILHGGFVGMAGVGFCESGLGFLPVGMGVARLSRRVGAGFHGPGSGVCLLGGVVCVG